MDLQEVDRTTETVRFPSFTAPFTARKEGSMARSPFSIYTRTGRDGRKLFCARFFDGDTAVKSVTLWEARSPTAAARLADSMYKAGVSSRSNNPPAYGYCQGFWTRDSDYVQGRALRGRVLSEKYLLESRRVLKTHLKTYLGEKKLLDLTPDFLEKTILDLNRQGVGARLINMSLQALRVPYGYFCRLNRIANALTCIEKVAEVHKERGVLSHKEVGMIIRLAGESPRAKAAVLLATLCGLRMGEVRGLQVSDVDYDSGIIHIRHNLVSETEGLKQPKWGSMRDVPAPQPVLDELKLCRAVASKGTGNFIFWNDRRPEAPMSILGIQAGFRRILSSIGIDKTSRKSRNLCFHGLRHAFVSLSRSSGIPDYAVQRMAGHSSMKMTDRYSHVMIDFDTARRAMEHVVGQERMA
jgi:integrase